jgi:hypothetical protein
LAEVDAARQGADALTMRFLGTASSSIILESRRQQHLARAPTRALDGEIPFASAFFSPLMGLPEQHWLLGWIVAVTAQLTHHW